MDSWLCLELLHMVDDVVHEAAHRRVAFSLEHQCDRPLSRLDDDGLAKLGGWAIDMLVTKPEPVVWEWMLSEGHGLRVLGLGLGLGPGPSVGETSEGDEGGDHE